MRRRPKTRNAPATVLGVLAVIIAAGGSAYAATAQSGRTISACVRQRGGTLYDAHRCARHDQRLRWGITGPRGTAGITGATGAAGPSGKPGAQGMGGPQGPKGNTGSPGAKGNAGATGPQGPTGANGATNVTVRSYSVHIGPNNGGGSYADCDTGEVATGGGVDLNGGVTGTGITVGTSRPYPTSGTPTAWYAVMNNASSTDGTVNVYVICASP